MSGLELNIQSAKIITDAPHRVIPQDNASGIIASIYLGRINLDATTQEFSGSLPKESEGVDIILHVAGEPAPTEFSWLKKGDSFGLSCIETMQSITITNTGITQS